MNALTFGGITQDLIGKSAYKLFDENSAKSIEKSEYEIIHNKIGCLVEETIMINGEKRVYISNKIPLLDSQGEVKGILGVSIEIINTKFYKRYHAFEGETLSLKSLAENALKKVIKEFPGNFYWFDKNGKVLGCNDNQAISLGFISGDELIGLNVYDIMQNHSSHAMLKLLQETNNDILKTGKVLTFEEEILVKGQKHVYLSTKAPLRDEKEEIIGVTGISFNITEQKEAKNLYNSLKEQEKITKIANQVAHDIASPTAALSVLVKICKDIPEDARLLLIVTATRINDIAHNLLSQYRNKDSEQNIQQEPIEILLSTNILKIISEKRLEYASSFIEFLYIANHESNFAFIKAQSSMLMRSLSNIINNAIDALQNKKEGKIVIKLNVSKEWVQIIIEDNGTGIPSEILEKITNNIAITHNKIDGHGIGLSVVRDMLQANNGKFAIDSKIDKGTNITLTFPRLKAPNWIVEEINLNNDDIIIMLDDDPSIHRAWDTLFENILESFPNIKIKHFQHGNETLEFIKSLDPVNKKKVLLLTDFELLKQEFNGLQIVIQSGVERSILVTSHFGSKDIEAQAIKIGTKILPKQLVSMVPITITEYNEKVYI